MGDGMNKVILHGNLGADPELRYTSAGVAVLNMRLATNERFVDKNREVQERTEWHSVVVWGNRAEALSRMLSKGHGLLVEGGLRTQSYEKDGQRRYKTEVHARDVVLTGRRGRPGGTRAVVETLSEDPPFGSTEPPPGPVDELPY